MYIADRLRQLREAKNLSQGDIERRTGLLRCYVSRVENGHTVPAVETLEKFARALEVPIYQLFYDGEEPPKLSAVNRPDETNIRGISGPESRYLLKLQRALAQMHADDRTILMHLAQKVASRKR
jgi:transcriptional regulator with XRE-family HTH domain